MGHGKRIVFMGTPLFAVPSLNALIGAGNTVAAVVTQPDKPRGRGLTPMPSPVKQAALASGIEVLEPPKLRDGALIERLGSYRPDFIAVVAYGKILPPDILALPPGGCVNLHASLLPKYRGAAPINWAIINGERQTGVSTMLMDAGMDTGPVLLEATIEIKESDTAEDLARELSISGAKLLADTIGLLSDGKISPRPQDNTLATYAPVLKKEDGRIRWERTSRQIKDLVRGVYPWPGAYTSWKGRSIKIFRCAAKDGDTGAEPGTVIEAGNGAIGVACGSGVFDILELQPENKTRMSAADFIKGYRITRGDKLD